MIPMLPFYAREMGASAVEIGWLMAAYSIVQFFMAPVWGRASDIHGRKSILFLTVAGQAFSFFMAALAPGFLFLLLSRALAGGFGGNISAASAMMADLTGPKDRAKGMGLIGAAIGLGFVFGPALGGVLIQWDYTWPSWAAGILACFNLFLVFFLLKEPLKKKIERSSNRRSFSFEGLGLVFKERNLFKACLMFFLFTAAFVQLEVSFGLLVVDRFSLSERSAGLLLGGVGLVMAFVQGGLVGRLATRFGEKLLIVFGSLFLAFGLLQLYLAANLVSLGLSLSFLALGYSLANPSLMSFASKTAGQERYGTVMGVYQSGGSLARALAPLAAGYFYGLHSGYPSLFGASLVLFGLAVWVLARPGFLRSDMSRTSQ